jgi:glycosyltransferase involved in cell wall biosynthesis
MTNPSLSIIMPVYNGAAYIGDALESLISQLQGSIELVVIDDGSTDGTVDVIARRFAADLLSGVLKMIVQKNQGVSAARNRGIDLASGRYIGFVDADDMVLPGYVEKIAEAMKSGADIIEFGFKPFHRSLDEVAHAAPEFTNRKFGLYRAGDLLDHVHAIARWYPATRVFRANLFTGIRFPPGVRMCEDVMTIPLLYEKADRILNLPTALYGYRTNLGSATFNVTHDYVVNLKTFYHTIPRLGRRRDDYLRIAIAYAIYSCQRRSGGGESLPEEIARDMRQLRYVASVYRAIEPRKIGILLYPLLFNTIRRIGSFMKPQSS